MPDLPIACNMDVFTPEEAERHMALSRLLVERHRRTRELDSGYALDVDGRGRSLAEVAEWASLERLCCPFLDITIEQRSGSDEVVLALTGPQGAKAFLAEELSVVVRG